MPCELAVDPIVFSGFPAGCALKDTHVIVPWSPRRSRPCTRAWNAPSLLRLFVSRGRNRAWHPACQTTMDGDAALRLAGRRSFREMPRTAVAAKEIRIMGKPTRTTQLTSVLFLITVAVFAL